MRPALHIGTSGWTYPHWRDVFYSGIRRADWLRHYATRFDAVEVNASFYRLQNEQTLRRWADETPDHFRFAAKGHRYLTHNKKLREADEAIRLERARMQSALAGKLSAILWQLPANLHLDLPRLQSFVGALTLWPEVRHAIEFRHRSWFTEQTAACLRGADVAVCQSDAADWPLWDAVTTNLVYVRLHGHTQTYASRYSEGAIQTWAKRVRTWRKAGCTVHVYFDNDAAGAAPADAQRLRAALRLPQKDTAPF